MPSLEQLLNYKPEELEALSDEEIAKFATPYHKMTIPHLANPQGLKFGGTSHITQGTKDARKKKIEAVAEKQAVLDKLENLEGFEFMKDLLKNRGK
jgi:hypothetical protein